MAGDLKQITLELSAETKELLDRLAETVHLTLGELIDRAVLNIYCDEPKLALGVILDEIVILLTAGYLSEEQIHIIYACLTKVYINALNSPQTEKWGILTYFLEMHNRVRSIIAERDRQ